MRCSIRASPVPAAAAAAAAAYDDADAANDAANDVDDSDDVLSVSIVHVAKNKQMNIFILLHNPQISHR